MFVRENMTRCRHRLGLVASKPTFGSCMGGPREGSISRRGAPSQGVCARTTDFGTAPSASESKLPLTRLLRVSPRLPRRMSRYTDRPEGHSGLPFVRIEQASVRVVLID